MVAGLGGGGRQHLAVGQLALGRRCQPSFGRGGKEPRFPITHCAGHLGGEPEKWTLISGND